MTSSTDLNGLTPENVKPGRQHATYMLSYSGDFRNDLNALIDAARAEGRPSPPVRVDGDDLKWLEDQKHVIDKRFPVPPQRVAHNARIDRILSALNTRSPEEDKRVGRLVEALEAVRDIVSRGKQWAYEVRLPRKHVLTMLTALVSFTKQEGNRGGSPSASPAMDAGSAMPSEGRE